MFFRVLGPLEIEVAGGPIDLPGPRPRALLTALLLQPNAVVSTGRLVDLVWDEEPPIAPLNALQQVVARLRGRAGELAERVQTSSGGYALVVPDGALDADVFEALWRDARACAAADPRRAAALLDRALALWRGPAYGEFADGFAQPASVRLAELRAKAQEDRVAFHLAMGETTEAVAAARSLVAADPMRERPVELMMRALQADGRTPEALDGFRAHRALLADELGLDPSPELRALEARILQDEVENPAAPTAAPPEPAQETRLPLRPGTMVGREADLSLLDGCLLTRRLVTLVGPGGVGKTRLALEAAQASAAEGRATWWADVTTVPGHRLVDVLAEACSVEIPRGADPAASLATSLTGSHGLLVVDNAESVLDELAPVVERLVATAPDLLVLATSRERLAVGHEHVHLLAPLPLPSGADRDNPAVRLFLERAAGLGDGVLADEEVAEIAELCRRLDGLPLAIELGAARAPAFGIREFTAQIAAGMDLLAGGRRTASARHRTLRAVVDASYALLSPPEAALLARLTVFPGPFDLDQVRAVCADQDLPARSVGPLLARLVEQSLVQSGQGRFWLLETLRGYTCEHLTEDQQERLRRVHARHTASRLEGLRWQQAPATEPEVVAELAGMSADLHLAWDHAVHHDRNLAVELAANVYDYAYARQRRDLLEWGLVVAGWDIDHPRLPRALATAAVAAWADGDLQLAERLAQRGLAAGKGDQDPATARSMVQSAILSMFAGRPEEAMDRYARAGALYLAAGEAVHSLMTEMSVAQTMTYAGRASEALERMAALLAKARATGNPTALSWAHFVTGEALSGTDPEAASVAYQAAYDEGRRSDNRLFMGLARSSRVALAARFGPTDGALRDFEDVLEEWVDLRNEAVQWGVLHHLAVLLVRVGSLQEAAVLLGAVRAARGRQPLYALREAELEQCLDVVRQRLGQAGRDRLTEYGAALPIDATVTEARQAIRAARPRLSVRPGMPR